MAPKICLNCGDKGFSNAFIHCVNCLEVVIHRYCLYKVTFNEFVPWLCDDCKDNEITRTTNSNDVPPRADLVEHKPVDDPIWRGFCNIWNKKYKLNGVVAHLSDKASQSVSENAQLLKPHLYFEMVSKADLWPKYFNTSEATVDDIELFFFPSEARHQDNFDRLVEDMIGEEHALRALTPHGELLVFTSTELPLRHWRYELKCYLWGIFRAKQGSSSRLLVPNRIQSRMVRQTPNNVLAARDVVNNRAPTEVDAEVITNELGKGKRTKIRTAKLSDYV